MEPSPLSKLKDPLLTRAVTEPSPLTKLHDPLLTRAVTEASIQAFERKRQEKAERQKNAIIDAAIALRQFQGLSLHSLNDNAKMLSLSLFFISCHLLSGVLYFHFIVGWPIDGAATVQSPAIRSHPTAHAATRSRLTAHAAAAAPEPSR